MKEKIYDTIIIGAGVAGMTSAIYLKRFGYNVLLLEKNAPGGQINKASKIENYPGYKTIDGPTLSYNIYEQVINLDIEYKYGNVINIKDNNNEKYIFTDKEILKTKTVIIATGRIPQKLNLKNEDKLIGKGISYCAICDGMFFENQDICVVGGGNSAVEESLYLANICKNVTIINRSNKLKADIHLIKLMEKHNNINIFYNSNIKQINESNGVLESLDIMKGNEKVNIKTKGLFIYIGSTPDVTFLNELDITINNNYIVVDKNMKTNIAGIYACGDVIEKSLYQITTAIGEASIAANSIKNYLNE